MYEIYAWYIDSPFEYITRNFIFNVHCVTLLARTHHLTFRSKGVYSCLLRKYKCLPGYQNYWKPSRFYIDTGCVFFRINATIKKRQRNIHNTTTSFRNKIQRGAGGLARGRYSEKMTSLHLRQERNKNHIKGTRCLLVFPFYVFRILSSVGLSI